MNYKTAFVIHNRCKSFYACIFAYSYDEAFSIAWSYARGNSALTGYRIK